MSVKKILEYLQGETILGIEYIESKYNAVIIIHTKKGKMTITSDKTDCDPEYVQSSFLLLSIFDKDNNILGAI